MSDPRIADLPLDLVERMHPVGAEMPGDGQPLRAILSQRQFSRIGTGHGPSPSDLCSSDCWFIQLSRYSKHFGPHMSARLEAASRTQTGVHIYMTN